MDRPRCKVEGCKNIASHGVRKTKIPLTCKKHQFAFKDENGRYYVPVSRYCSYTDCLKTRVGGGLFCEKHCDDGSRERLLPGSLLKINKEIPRDGVRCIIDGCERLPTHASSLDKVPVVCRVHYTYLRDAKGHKYQPFSKFCIEPECTSFRRMPSLLCIYHKAEREQQQSQPQDEIAKNARIAGIAIDKSKPRDGSCCIIAECDEIPKYCLRESKEKATIICFRHVKYFPFGQFAHISNLCRDPSCVKFRRGEFCRLHSKEEDTSSQIDRAQFPEEPEAPQPAPKLMKIVCPFCSTEIYAQYFSLQIEESQPKIVTCQICNMPVTFDPSEIS